MICSIRVPVIYRSVSRFLLPHTMLLKICTVTQSVHSADCTLPLAGVQSLPDGERDASYDSSDAEPTQRDNISRSEPPPEDTRVCAAPNPVTFLLNPGAPFQTRLSPEGTVRITCRTCSGLNLTCHQGSYILQTSCLSMHPLRRGSISIFPPLHSSLQMATPSDPQTLCTF